MISFICRYTVTVGGSTWTIRYLSRRGVMTSTELKDELTERSDQLKVFCSYKNTIIECKNLGLFLPNFIVNHFQYLFSVLETR